MPFFPFTVSISAFSKEEAKSKVQMLFEWAALPVERDLLSFGLAALNCWVHKENNTLSGNTALQTKSQHDIKVYLLGRTLQEAEARFNLIMQWAAYPVDRNWRGLLGCGLRYLIFSVSASYKEEAEIEKAFMNSKMRYSASKRRMRTTS
jgi:hypothetical protein